MAKSATERLNAKKDHKVVVLENDFAGVKKGQKLFVATPGIIDSYIRKIPRGQTRTIERMRNELARRWSCSATCPVSTAIFVRIAAQAALEKLEAGSPESGITPFWRLVEPDSKIAGKLDVDSAWIAMKREAEQG
ncbi:hypothetical protein [Kiloniella sp. b19]|uniref:hypothetical protein n=1 Tax=Kiloniella sp. GXU_MW_B19 TaxID=3141326 RepID=UPI0031D6544A